MMARHLETMVFRIAEARSICRAFSTYSPRQQTAAVPATSNASTPYYTERDRNQKKDQGLRLVKDLAAATHRPAYNNVSAYDRTRDRLADVAKAKRTLDLERQIHRKWKTGDVYAPHDLSPVEQMKWQKRRPRETDAFDQLGINPLHEYKNFSIMAEYVTQIGRIKHRKQTGLRAVNQRKIAKAIRRAVGMGLMPSVHKHPEVLEVEAKIRNERLMGGRP